MGYHIWVKKSKAYSNRDMWVGKCSCGHDIQYWSWGATLGAMLQHHWKEHS